MQQYRDYAKFYDKKGSLMNYRHIYHAGNFADVFKHICLTAILLHLKKKAAPFCFLDVQAGIGLYDLQSVEAQKTKEYGNGIQKIWAQKKMPELIQTYLTIIQQYNKNKRASRDLSLQKDELHFYPGSPFIAKNLLRKQDRLILCELHTEDYVSLKNYFAHDKQVNVHHQDAYLALNAFLPPKEKRGLVLIDPSYEIENEFEKIIGHLLLALKKWPAGIYALWYPIKINQPINFFLNQFKPIKQPILRLETHIKSNTEEGLIGCGMIVINPPWQMETALLPAIKWIEEILKN